MNPKHTLSQPRPPTNAGWSSPVARQAHNLKVRGSNPLPATKQHEPKQGVRRNPDAAFVSQRAWPARSRFRLAAYGYAEGAIQSVGIGFWVVFSRVRYGFVQRNTSMTCLRIRRLRQPFFGY